MSLLENPLDINRDLGNCVLLEGFTLENCPKVKELQFAALLSQTEINFTQGKKVSKCFELVEQDRSSRYVHVVLKTFLTS